MYFNINNYFNNRDSRFAVLLIIIIITFVYHILINHYFASLGKQRKIGGKNNIENLKTSNNMYI